MSASTTQRWLAPIEREAAALLVDLLRLGALRRAALELDPDTGSVAVVATTDGGEEVRGLLAFADLMPAD